MVVFLVEIFLRLLVEANMVEYYLTVIMWIESLFALSNNPAGNYMFKVNNRNSITRCEICSKFTIKIPERRQWRK